MTEIRRHLEMAPIGVFDSGMGGLTVVRALRTALPNERFIYLGDTARVPYGTKSASTVIRYSSQIAAVLLQRGIKYLVAACNTASAHALGHLQAQMPVPVMGVVEPGANVASVASRRGKIGVIGTRGTINSGAYQVALKRSNPLLEVVGQACPLLVPLAEEGWIDHPVTSQIVAHYLTEIRGKCSDLDTIVLGCTHYPVLREVIASQADIIFAHPVTLVDSAQTVAEAVKKDLETRGLSFVGQSEEQGAEDLFIFSDTTRFDTVGKIFLGMDIQQAELIDI
ncbi:MAG: glutamate racemase [Pseudomonadota bacterium]